MSFIDDLATIDIRVAIAALGRDLVLAVEDAPALDEVAHLVEVYVEAAVGERTILDIEIRDLDLDEARRTGDPRLVELADAARMLLEASFDLGGIEDVHDDVVIARTFEQVRVRLRGVAEELERLQPGAEDRMRAAVAAAFAAA